MKTPAALVALIVVSTLAIDAQDWTQWRGPSRTGNAPSFTPPASWPERPRQVWKVTAGEGHSSPVVRGARVYLFSRTGEQEALAAFDLATGKEVWRQAYAAPYQMNPAATSHGKGSKSTPLVHRGRIYALGIGGVLTAFDEVSGRVVWRKDFKGEFSQLSPAFGASMSPVAEGDTVIAHVGGEGNGALTAFDAATGAPRWSWKGDGPAYASPVVADLGGVRQLITQTQSHIVGLAAADGKPLWQLPFTTDYEQNIVTPLVVGDLLVYGGLSKATTAVRVSREGGKWTTSEVWKNSDVPMYMSSPVEAGGVIVGLTHRNRGQFFALDAKTGKLLWTSPGRQGENAALVTAGNDVVATTTEGELVVMRAGPKAFEAVRRYTVADSPIWAHPVPAGKNGILIKDAATLSYWTF
jgi:outer membrane protein assembly factor BamB